MRSVASEQMPAIVVGRGFTALGALRSLRLAGISAYVACPSGDIATRSRYYRPTPGVQAWQGQLGAVAVEALAAMPLREAVLIPAADDVALWLSELPDALAERFHVSSSSRQTLDILQDKAHFGAWLTAHDIPHPRTYAIESASDIEAIPFAEMERVFMKPVDSQSFSQSLGIKALWTRNRQEFVEAWQRLQERGLAVMAQEYIPGGCDEHYFIDGFRDHEGNCPGRFARRRRRIYPADFGNSSYAESIPFGEVEGAWETLSRMLAKLQYRGIFSAEFKRDARDGKFKVLEVNTRAWWYVEFAARCGVNVCEMSFHDARRLPVPAGRSVYEVGAGSVNFSGDVKTVWTTRRDVRDPLWRILGQWLRAHYLVFRLDDPRPGLVMMTAAISNLIRRRLFGWFRERRAVRRKSAGRGAGVMDREPKP